MIPFVLCPLQTEWGAIALIRVSGARALEITSSIFSKDLTLVQSHTAHFGTVRNAEGILDEVVVTVFSCRKEFYRRTYH
jgi:tRNA modification GTPase